MWWWVFLCVWRVYTRSGCSFRLERLFTHISDKMWTQNDTIQVQITYMRKTFTNIIFNSMNCNYFSKSHSQQVAIPKPPTPTHVFLRTHRRTAQLPRFFRKENYADKARDDEWKCLLICVWVLIFTKHKVFSHSCSLSPTLQFLVLIESSVSN